MTTIDEQVDYDAFTYPREALVQHREAGYAQGQADGQERVGLVLLAVGHWIGVVSQGDFPTELLDSLRDAVLDPRAYLGDDA